MALRGVPRVETLSDKRHTYTRLGKPSPRDDSGGKGAEEQGKQGDWWEACWGWVHG